MSWAGFKTGQGSVYSYGGGKSQRIKSPHVGHDKKDVGLKAMSDLTVFISGGSSPFGGIGAWQSLSSKDKRMYLHGDSLVMTSMNEQTGQRGRDEEPIPFKNEPGIGLHPVELWGEGTDEHGRYFTGTHPGNAITSELSADDISQHFAAPDDVGGGGSSPPDLPSVLGGSGGNDEWWPPEDTPRRMNQAEPSNVADVLGDGGNEYQPLPQPEERKKKRQRSEPQTDWGSLLGSVSHVATSLGQESRSGSSTSGLDQWESILTGKADIPGMLGNAGESIVNLLSGGQSGGNTADSKETSEIAEEKFDDLTKAVEALTKAVEKLTEKMGSIGDKKEREPFAGKGGTNMPDDGSLQGRNQDGTGGTTAKEGNDEIMTTIIRMAMMAAEAV